MRLVIATLILTAALAGCLSSGAPDEGNQGDECLLTEHDVPGVQIMAPSEDPIVEDKGESANHESYNKRTCSLPPIGHSALSPDGVPHKYIGEIDMRADLGLGAVAVLGNGETPGVYILNITDGPNPTVIAYIEQASTYLTDVKFSDDGKILYTASQVGSLSPELPALQDTTSPVGFSAYNIEDPENPRYLGTIPDSQTGCHMLDPVQVSTTQDAVFCVSQHIRSYLIERGDNFATLGFVDYVPSENGVPAPSVPVGGGACAGPLCTTQGPHDMTAYHEGEGFGDGSSYMIVSHWGAGVRVLDITDAPLITEVGSWKGEGATHYAGNVHTAMMFMVGDQRYIVASPEYTGGLGAETVPSLWVLDATDLSDLKLVAEWFHPGEHPSGGLYLTIHQWQVAPTGAELTPDDVRIYMSYNHAGIWVLDFGQILAGNNEDAILGYNLARPPLPDGHVGNAVLSTWDVDVADGYIYGSDRATGLWVFGYEGDQPGDQRLRGFA